MECRVCGKKRRPAKKNEKAMSRLSSWFVSKKTLASVSSEVCTPCVDSVFWKMGATVVDRLNMTLGELEAENTDRDEK